MLKLETVIVLEEKNLNSRLDNHLGLLGAPGDLISSSSSQSHVSPQS